MSSVALSCLIPCYALGTAFSYCLAFFEHHLLRSCHDIDVEQIRAKAGFREATMLMALWLGKEQ